MAFGPTKTETGSPAFDEAAEEVTQGLADDQDLRADLVRHTEELYDLVTSELAKHLSEEAYEQWNQGKHTLGEALSMYFLSVKATIQNLRETPADTVGETLPSKLRPSHQLLYLNTSGGAEAYSALVDDLRHMQGTSRTREEAIFAREALNFMGAAWKYRKQLDG